MKGIERRTKCIIKGERNKGQIKRIIEKKQQHTRKLIKKLTKEEQTCVRRGKNGLMFPGIPEGTLHFVFPEPGSYALSTKDCRGN